jgi:PAS domain S-box-containing protein
MQGVFGALLQTQTELQQFMERIPDTLVVHRDGVIVWANKALLDAIGYASVEDIRGKRIVDFIHPLDKDSAAARLASPVEIAGTGRYRVRAADGSFRTLEPSAPQSVIFDGTPARMALARDVTERDALREQLVFADRMSQLGFLAAGVAHEINNPLAYSLAALDRARQDIAAGRLPQATSSLAIAREGAERVRAITSDLRMFSRGGEQRVEGVDVSHVLRATVDLAAASINTRGRLVTDVGTLPMVLADEARLGQVFMNLLVNALDALADRDPRKSRIDVRAFTDGGGRAVVEVEDNGRGIPPDLLPRIFEPFFTTKGPRAGSGLGLAICHHIVNELGGRVEVASPPGKGALFRVILPPYSGEATRVEAAGARRPRRLRVLVVDDEPSLANAIGRMLEEVHDVDVVTSGEEALRRVEAGAEYDAILCDLMMPGVGGMDVYERLALGWPKMARRLVFMTGGAFSTRAQRFLGEVPNTCLDKPFTPERVIEALETVGRVEKSPADTSVAAVAGIKGEDNRARVEVE